MSDDSFIREVSEELRQDRLRAFWARFGTTIIVAVVAIIVAAAAYVGWDRYQASQAAASGDRYMNALDAARNGDHDAALDEFRAIRDDGYGVYPALAAMSLGGALADRGNAQEAVAAFDAVADGGEAPQPVRDMAALRAGYILVDTGSLADVRQRVERLTGDSQALRYPAREAVALAAWKADDFDTARPLYEELANDDGAPNGIRQRAQVMVDLIAGGAATTATPVPDTAPAPSPSAPSDNPSAPAEGTSGTSASGGQAPSLGGIAVPTTDLGADASGGNAPSTGDGSANETSGGSGETPQTDATPAPDNGAGSTPASVGGANGNQDGSGQP